MLTLTLNDIEAIPPKVHGASGDDNGFNDLTPARYVEICVGDQIAYLRAKMTQLDRDWKLWQFVAYAFVALGSVLAAMGAMLWVPVAATVVTAIMTLIRTQQYDALLAKHNQAETDLVNLRIWWECLPPRAQRRQVNIDTLARLTKDILQLENAGCVQRMQDALDSLRGAQQEQTIAKDQGE